MSLDFGPLVEELRKQKLVVVIPFPSTDPRRRGIRARGGHGKNYARHTYYAPDELQLVFKACDYLGLSYSSFTRWCAVKVALEVLKDAEPEVPD